MSDTVNHGRSAELDGMATRFLRDARLHEYSKVFYQYARGTFPWYWRIFYWFCITQGWPMWDKAFRADYSDPMKTPVGDVRHRNHLIAESLVRQPDLGVTYLAAMRMGGLALRAVTRHRQDGSADTVIEIPQAAPYGDFLAQVAIARAMIKMATEDAADFKFARLEPPDGAYFDIATARNSLNTKHGNKATLRFRMK